MNGFIESTGNISYVAAKDIDYIISSNRARIIDIVHDTYNNYYSGSAINLGTFSLKFDDIPNARINALPASISGDTNIAGMKWVSSFPDNTKKNMQRASALIILNSMETGYPRVVLDGTRISSARTAASAVLSAKLLNPQKKFKKSTFYGAGILNRDIFDFFISDKWCLGETNVVDLDSNCKNKFDEYIGNQRVDYKNSEHTTSQHELISLATSALNPWYDQDINSKQIILHVSLRDLKPKLLHKVNNIVDDIKLATSSNTSLDLYNRENCDAGNIYNLDAIEKKLIDVDKPSVVAAFGMGILDLAVSNFIVNIAEKENKLKGIDGMLSNMVRWE